ncbi:glycoside hydrolase family 78 protein [Streptomyces heilongjiangensis]|uniref:alpha-L-rhamnosidase n=1 Tax=Streptomyces heilongjiangensis TaxID=945052 RepID=A0ABW1BJR2_9ACTN|nr:glycoside hydrolase family 78 protein [Streptomyces heilongjiangensis]MDC2951964.1 glycoside hydrolase family 78 protein [Streptomyces heilongjiangensis]
MYVTDLRFEHHREPLGIGEDSPRLTWTARTEHPEGAERQHACQIEIRDAAGRVETHRVDGSESVLVPWPAAPLRSRERREVRVRLHAEGSREPGPWSDFFPVEAGLLHPGDWTGTAIGPDCDDPAAADPRPAYLLRDAFHLARPVAVARLYVTALGVCDMEVNGRPVGRDVLTPGWTSYQDRLRYRTYDVTDLLHEGDNAWGAQLADGWYRGRLGFNGGIRDIYGERTALLAQLEVTYGDGTTDTFTTHPGWRSTPGPVLATGLLEGETHDARRERTGWSRSGHGTADWSGVIPVALDTALLRAPDGPPVRRTQEIAPAAVRTVAEGRFLVDFGQNLVGRLRIRVRGRAGRTVTLRHAEVLEDGGLCTRPLRGAAATDHYTLRGDPDGEEWEPRFTLHGFRYAEISGWPGVLAPEDLTAVVLHTDMRRTGHFSCSDPALDRLHENVVWSMRGNFVDIPTDCPQRDERLGWTGDVQVFAPTAAFLYDCAGLLASWLRDLIADTDRDPGGVTPLWSPQIPAIFPFEVPATNRPMAGWGDAAVIVPWTLYQRYGDLEILRRQYPDMRRWVDVVDQAVGPGHLWTDEFQFGDWLDPTAPPDDPTRGSTPKALVGTAYFAHSTTLLAATAALLGHTDDHTRYTRLADAIRAVFHHAFVEEPGRLAGDSQTAYALALVFDLLPREHRGAAGDRLAELVAEGGHRIGTGFLGTPLVCDALTATGHVDTAYRLLTQRSCPSWLHQVDMGATTVWERWDSMLPDGRVNPGEMTSFNHYAFGAVADWLHRTVAGLAPAAPGYRRLLVRPRPGGGLTWARAAHETPYGRAEVAWHLDHGVLTVEVTVPPGAEALIDLPGTTPTTVGPGHHTFSAPVPSTIAPGPEKTRLGVR